jgi:hypothetical protein
VLSRRLRLPSLRQPEGSAAGQGLDSPVDT